MELKVIYALWLREIKVFLRSKSRIIGSLFMPLLFLIGFAGGFRGTRIQGIPSEINYIQFLVPGIIAFGLMMRSTMGGISVLWDKEFGFLKEIMVAPVKRTSIVLGRIAGSSTVSVLQGLMIALISVIIGFKLPSILNLIISLIVMILISIVFTSIGLIIASLMKDFQGFNLIMNIILMPLFFLSGAMYPISNLPRMVQGISYVNPLTFGVNALRYLLVGFAPINFILSFIILLAFSFILTISAAILFNKSESV